MPRGPRLDAPGALHHVTARGIDHGTIVRDEADRQGLVDALRRVVIDGGAAVYAWSFLANQLHLLIRTGSTSLSLLMRRLLTTHAVRFNRRHGRGGHVFQNRFKSTLVQDESYFLELVRYIHVMPLRAGVVSTLDELDCYPWTGHRLLMGASGPCWQSVAAVLSRFDTDAVAARSAYRRFIAEGCSRREHEIEGGGFRRRGNGWELVEALPRAREAWVLAERVLARPTALSHLATALPIVKYPQAAVAPIDPSVLVERVTQQLGLTAAVVAGGGRYRSATSVRALLAHLLVRRCGLSFNQTARALGISRWRVRRAVQQTEAGCEPSAVSELVTTLVRQGREP